MLLKDTFLYLAQNQQIRDFVVQNKFTRNISRRFVAGELLTDALQATQELNAQGIQVALDLLGENVSSADEAHQATGNYLAALDLVKDTGIDANISIKLTALGLDISQELCEQNLTEILQAAQQRNVFVCVDMEGSAYTERTVALTLKMHTQFALVGTVIQAYLYRSRDDVGQLIKQGIRVRLVKGAYKEPASIAYQQKSDVDSAYIELMHMLLAGGNFPAVATHDETILAEARNFVRNQGIQRTAFEFQMLYGIRRNLQKQLVQWQYNMRVYVPYGTQWYPYLMRRMAERPANLMFVVSNSLR
ncbi:MAG TPA: proline dehydrogenase family protein [Ktedonobacteraceae bacterium]|jgi:proline dehydrogenase|nr:proline dehydrogenase family protein [Ktedonobacteraceae bacterium]